MQELIDVMVGMGYNYGSVWLLAYLLLFSLLKLKSVPELKSVGRKWAADA